MFLGEGEGRTSADAIERRDLRVGEGFPEEVIFELGLHEEQELLSVDREDQKHRVVGWSSKSVVGGNGREVG